MNLKDYLDKKRQSRRNFFSLFAIFVVIALCLFFMNRIDKRFVLSIDSIEFRDKSEFTVGAGSDLAFNTVPHDYMTIRHQGEMFKWEIDSLRDSLCYFQINGKNPNTCPISEQSSIQISNVVNGHQTINLTGKQLMDCIKQFDDTEYALLRNILVLIGDSTIEQEVMNDRSLVSLVYKNKNTDAVSIVILDTHTKVDGKGYAFNGTTEELTPDYKNNCKIQFFAVKDFSVKYSKVETDMLNVDGLNYVAKPVLLTTEWGAGHILLKPNENSSIKVCFPKGLMYVESIDSLRRIAGLQSGLITIKQFSNNPPLSNNIYLPSFSDAINSDICYLNFKDNHIQIETNSGESFIIESKLQFVPTLKSTSFDSGVDEVNCRYGFLDGKYIYSYLISPFFMLLFIIVTHSCLIRRKNILKFRRTDIRAHIFPSYFIAIAVIAFAYCVGKSMISLKLSYTYPYFEKLTGIIVVATSLFLLLFYLISLLLNFKFIRETAFQKARSIKKYTLLFAPFVIGMLGVIFSFYVLCMLDRGINAEVHSSYFSDEWYTPIVWLWGDMAGINDTHRSVVYTLFLACMFVSILLLLQAVLSLNKNTREFRFFDKIDEWTTFKFQWIEPSRGNWVAVIVHTVTYLLNNLFVIVLLLMLTWLIPGNFATAFITAISIWGLARSLTNINSEEGAIANIFEMVLSSVVIILVAFIPDHGYMTNYFGFFAAVVAFYMLMQKSYLSTALSKKERDRRKKEEKWIPRIGVVLALIFFSAPFIYNMCKSPEDVDYGRGSRRFMMASQFEQYHESGYRYADSDVEFMKILFHYMSSANGIDPLSNEKHQLHPSISTGQSPVILNDVSLPGAFISPYGWGSYIVYFALLALLFYIVMTFSLTGTANDSDITFDRYTQWRLLAMLMWVGTSLYLFLSYCGVLPFTGRLNPGFGVDSVGEALESAILLAIMTATTLKLER